MTTRRGWGGAIVALAAVVGVVTGCTGTETISGSGESGPEALDDVRLVSYDSCDGLLAWFHSEAGARVGAYGLEGGAYPMATRGAVEGDSSSSASTAMDTAAASPKSADETSTTNTQEPGIGEPDLAWTDGHRLVTVVTGRLEVVDLDRGAVTATVDLTDPDGGGPPLGLLVDGDHAV